MFNTTTIGQGIGYLNTRLLSWGLGWQAIIIPIEYIEVPVVDYLFWFECAFGEWKNPPD